MFPFIIKITEPDIIQIFKRLEQDRIAQLPKYTTKKLSWKLKPIRSSIILADNYRYNEKWMALKPDLKLEMTPLNDKKTAYKVKFHF